MSKNDGGPAFPNPVGDKQAQDPTSRWMGRVPQPGLSIRDWFAGQALASGLIHDVYPDWQLRAWFGDRSGLHREEIAARASYELADALLKAREE